MWGRASQEKSGRGKPESRKETTAGDSKEKVERDPERTRRRQTGGVGQDIARELALDRGVERAWRPGTGGGLVSRSATTSSCGRSQGSSSWRRASSASLLGTLRGSPPAQHPLGGRLDHAPNQ